MSTMALHDLLNLVYYLKGLYCKADCAIFNFALFALPKAGAKIKTCELPFSV